MVFLSTPLSVFGSAASYDTTYRGSNHYGKGYRYNIGGWIYLHIEGDPYERGFQHGYLLANEIVDVIHRWSSIFPQKWSWELHRRSAVRLFWNKYPEEYKQEIIGIADGVAARRDKIDGPPVDFKDILSLNEMYELLSRFRTYSVYPFRLRSNWLLRGIYDFVTSGRSSSQGLKGTCSAFLATGDFTREGGIVAAHSTRGYAAEDMWWHIYVAERYNVILDIQPTSGYRVLMSTSPGFIWSGEDFYQNSAGMILMETTLDPLGRWTRRGDPVVIRARKAIQYSDSIDDIVDCFLENNNGLMANDWLIGDTKTGEIASLELALYNHGLRRTKNGFIWSCNNVKDDRVRWELNSIFGLGFLGRLLKKDFEPTKRDLKFEEMRDVYLGKIDVDVAKKIMSTYPISEKMFDCKITDSRLIDNFGVWCFMGNPDGSDFIAGENPFKKPRVGYTDLPASGWVQLYGLSHPNKYRREKQDLDYKSKRGRLFWECETGVFGNAIYSSPTVKDDILYVSSWNGNIAAIDVNSASPLWKRNIGWSSASSPMVFDEIVYVGCSDGLYALNKNNGAVIWKNTLGTVSSRPLVFDGRVYCGSHEGIVYAFDARNGEMVWKYETNGGIYTSPAVHNNILYVGSNDNHLYAFDAEDGEVKWSFRTNGAVCSSPVVFDDLVFFGSWDNNLYALNCETGKLMWKFTAGWGIDSSPAIGYDTLFIGSRDNNLYALDPWNGRLKWLFTANAGIHSSPLVYGGFVFFGCDDGRIYALDATDGDLVWSDAPDYFVQGVYNYVTRPIVSSPVASEGRLYIGSTNGRIYVYDDVAAEVKQPLSEKIDVSFETWFFVTMSFFSVIMTTTIYLFFEMRRFK
jgi:outer membrane protein assembly factor BamB